MEVIEQISKAVTILDELEEYNEELPKRLQEEDLRLSDLYHYIENNNLNAPQCCKIVKEIKKRREERRKIKKEMALLRTYSNNCNRLSNADNRKFLVAEVHKTEKQLPSNYKNRIYSEEELKELLEIKKEVGI